MQLKVHLDSEHDSPIKTHLTVVAFSASLKPIRSSVLLVGSEHNFDIKQVLQGVPLVWLIFMLTRNNSM